MAGVVTGFRMKNCFHFPLKSQTKAVLTRFYKNKTMLPSTLQFTLSFNEIKKRTSTIYMNVQFASYDFFGKLLTELFVFYKMLVLLNLTKNTFKNY